MLQKKYENPTQLMSILLFNLITRIRKSRRLLKTAFPREHLKYSSISARFSHFAAAPTDRKSKFTPRHNKQLGKSNRKRERWQRGRGSKHVDYKKGD